MSSQVEAACALVEKLITENADLVEKVTLVNSQRFNFHERKFYCFSLFSTNILQEFFKWYCATFIESRRVVWVCLLEADLKLVSTILSLYLLSFISLLCLFLQVNELYVELDRYTAIARLSSTASAPDPMSPVNISVPDHLTPIKDNTMSISIQESDSVEGAPVEEDRNGISNTSSDHDDEIIKPSASDAANEIVQIPLDENEVRDLELQVAETDAEAGVPLSEAPLIGAPFRLVSFVARYVSGADLVNMNSFDSSR